ncbi:GAF and ANTAR domain-containing protein [Streptomyces sp. NPDC020858]|uniref:GAF and ANTAR domain-containing protein n=1 Tax=Streptomyces sp. NPDC020858 TaxID=3365097 RepID=UPI0037A2DEB6
MTGDRTARIKVLVARQAALRGARVGVVDVCTAAVATLPIGGAGVSAMSRTAAGHPLCSTDLVSERLEELQLTLGEGPCVDAYALGSAVLASDLRGDEERHRWPVFAPEATAAGAGSVFAFPLQIGAISPGVLDLYSGVPVELDSEQLADAMVLADTATLVLLGTRISEVGARPDGNPPPPGSQDACPADGRLEDLGGHRAEIDQATGMLTVQLGVDVEEAFVRLRAYAYTDGRRLAEVAADVVARRLRFRPGSDDGFGTADDA